MVTSSGVSFVIVCRGERPANEARSTTSCTSFYVATIDGPHQKGARDQSSKESRQRPRSIEITGNWTSGPK